MEKDESFKVILKLFSCQRAKQNYKSRLFISHFITFFGWMLQQQRENDTFVAACCSDDAELVFYFDSKVSLLDGSKAFLRLLTPILSCIELVFI